MNLLHSYPKTLMQLLAFSLFLFAHLYQLSHIFCLVSLHSAFTLPLHLFLALWLFSQILSPVLCFLPSPSWVRADPVWGWHLAHGCSCCLYRSWCKEETLHHAVEWNWESQEENVSRRALCSYLNASTCILLQWKVMVSSSAFIRNDDLLMSGRKYVQLRGFWPLKIWASLENSLHVRSVSYVTRGDVKPKSP